MTLEEIGRLIDHLLKTRSIFADSFFPKGAQQHFHKAKIDTLLGIKDVIEHQIKEELDKDLYKENHKEESKIKSIIITE